MPEGSQNPSKSIKIPTSFRYPQNQKKSEPRVTKSLPKWCPKPSPGHLKVNLLLNCKSNENNCIYYVLKTSRPRILVPCLLLNQQKNNYGICAVIGWCKWRKSDQHGSKVGPKGVPKSIKNVLKSKSGAQGVLLGVSGASGSTKWCPGTPKITPRDVKMHQPGVRTGIPGSQNGTTSLSESQPTVGTVAGCKQLDNNIILE